MSPVKVSGALLERLGEPASAQLGGILEAWKRESTEAVMSHCTDRFERRLVEETSKLQGDMAQWRGEMRTGFVELRGEMRTGFADLRQQMAADRFELLKWAFGFWVVQLLGVAGILGTLFNSARR